MKSDHTQNNECQQVVKAITRLQRNVKRIQHDTNRVLHIFPSWILPHPISIARYRFAQSKIKYFSKEFAVNILFLPKYHAYIFSELFSITVWKEMVIDNFIVKDHIDNNLSYNYEAIMVKMEEYESIYFQNVREAIQMSRADYTTTKSLLEAFDNLKTLALKLGQICSRPTLKIEGMDQMILSLVDHQKS